MQFGLTIYFSYLQVDLSPNGKEMMRNFLYDICGLSGTFTIKDRQEKCLQDIIETVGDNKVLVRGHSKMTSRKATNQIRGILFNFTRSKMSYPLNVI